MAGNQLGKTLAGGFEAAIHATGRYPEWWTGRRFDRPTIGWACGVTGEVVRDTVQRVLVGRSGQIGTGAIPKDAIAELVSARGIPDLLVLTQSKSVATVRFYPQKQRSPATAFMRHEIILGPNVGSMHVMAITKFQHRNLTLITEIRFLRVKCQLSLSSPKARPSVIKRT